MAESPPLNAKTVASATANPGERIVLRDPSMVGLELRVNGPKKRRATTQKVWGHRYRVGGKERRRRIGEYPGMTLSQARAEVRRRQVMLDAGEDPDAKITTPADRTFAAMAREVLAAKALSTRERTQRDRAALLERVLLPEWGERDAASISRYEIVQFVEAIAHRGHPVSANRTLGAIKMLFGAALDRGWPGLEANPTSRIKPPGEEKGRDRYLSVAEIKAVWDATEPEAVPTRSIFRLCLLTAARIGSVTKMRWGDIDSGRAEWVIPEQFFKGKREHLVPLPDEAMGVIAQLREVQLDPVWVFPARNGAANPYITNLNKARVRIRKRSGVPDWAPHDFRTTFRTHATRSTEDGGLGVESATADLSLGHAEGTLGWSRYQGDKLGYRRSEKKEALAKWGRFVATAVTGNPAPRNEIPAIRDDVVRNEGGDETPGGDSFLEDLLGEDKLPAATIQKIRKEIEDAGFDPDLLIGH